MLNAFLENNPSRQVTILDGALGTYLGACGEKLDDKLWSAGQLLSNPDAIQRVHKEYLEAGADIITTSSYQISYEGMQQYRGCTVDQTNDLILQSVDLARRAIAAHSHPALTAVSIGTYGAHLCNGSEYHGNFGLSASQLCEWHLPKLDFITNHCQPDIIAFETIPSLAEAKGICQASERVESIGTVSRWISLACSSATTLNDHSSIEEAVRIIEEHPATNDNMGIGVNCTDPRLVCDILCLMKDSAKKGRLLVAYPNRGDGWDDSHACYSTAILDCELDDRFMDYSGSWMMATGGGAKVIGGCCQTHPALIQRLKRHLQPQTT